MPTETIHVKLSGKTKTLQAETKGFVGEGCTGVINTLKSGLAASVIAEKRTAEADHELPPPISLCGEENITL